MFKIISIVALVLLGALAFSFLHSEVAMFSTDGAYHGHHDFCEIVKTTSVHQKTLKEQLGKFILSALNAPSLIADSLTDYVTLPYATPVKVSGSGEIYKLNRTLLI